MEKELASLRSAAESAQQAQVLAEQDCEKHKTLAMQSRDNYDREHTLHNATIAELAKAKEQRDALQVSFPHLCFMGPSPALCTCPNNTPVSSQTDSDLSAVRRGRRGYGVSTQQCRPR